MIIFVSANASFGPLFIYSVPTLLILMPLSRTQAGKRDVSALSPFGDTVHVLYTAYFLLSA